MKFTETRVLSGYQLRKCCIAHDWYTRGDNKEYNALFEKLPFDECGCREHITAEKLYELASDIHAHSEPRCSITAIMSELVKWCDTLFEIVE